jgi:hypothetical protein
MAKAITLLMALYNTMMTNAVAQHTCVASVFGYEDDEHKGGEAICVHRDLRPDEIGIANRDLPCFAKVMLINPRTNRKVVARVLDHGPYGAVYKGHWVVKRKPSDRGQWRGCVDLTQQAQKMLHHNGFEKLIYYTLNK